MDIQAVIPQVAQPRPSPLNIRHLRGGVSPALPAVPVPAAPGRLDVVAQMSASIMQQTESAPEALNNLCDALSRLHTALKEANSKENITTTLRESIHSIEDIMGNRPLHTLDHDALLRRLTTINEIFTYPGRPLPTQGAQDLFAENMLNNLNALKEKLTAYQATLKGEPGTECTRRELGRYRLALIETLHTQQGRGFLDYILSIKNLVQKSLATAIENMVQKTIRTTSRSFGYACERTVGINPTRSAPTQDDVDQPPLEIQNRDGEDVIIDHRKPAPLTIASIVSSLRDFIQEGETEGFQKCRLSFWGKLLTLLKQQLEKQNRQYIEEPGRAGGITEVQSTKNTHIMTSIDHALTIIADAQHMQTVDIARALSAISREMSAHPINLTSFFQWAPFAEVGEMQEVSTVEALLAQIQALDAADAIRPMGESSPEALIDKEMETLINNSAYISAYNTISYLAGPGSNGTQPMPSFQTMMAGFSCANKTDREIKTEVLTRIRTAIHKNSDLSIFSQALLHLSLPLLVGASKWAAKRFFRGARSYLAELTEETDKQTKKEVDRTPITTLGNVAASLAKARVEADNTLGNDNAVADSLERQHITENGHKLGYTDKEGMYALFTDKAVNEIMLSFQPTQFLDDTGSRLQHLAHRIDNLPLRFIANCFVAPLRLALWLVNQVCIAPIAYVSNGIIKRSAKKFLKRLGLVEKLVHITSESLFQKQESGSAEVMVNVMVNLVDMLIQKLDAPPEEGGSLSQLRTSPETSEALRKCLTQIFSTIDLEKCNSADERRLFLQGLSAHRSWNERVTESFGGELAPHVIKGVSDLLGRSFQLLMRKEMLNQQLYLLLHATNESMLKQEAPAPSDPAALQARAPVSSQEINVARLDRKIGLLLWKAIDLAGGVLSMNGGNDQDAPIETHVNALKQELGVTTNAEGETVITEEGKIARWQVLLNELPLSTAEQQLQTLFAIRGELRHFLNALHTELIRFKSEKRVSSASLTVHDAQIHTLIDDLHNFEVAFLSRYNAELRARLSDGAAQHVAAISTRILPTLISSLNELENEPTLIPTISGALETLRSTGNQFEALMQTEIAPTTLTQLFHRLARVIPRGEGLMQTIIMRNRFTQFIDHRLCRFIETQLGARSIDIMALRRELPLRLIELQAVLPEHGIAHTPDAIDYERIEAIIHQMTATATPAQQLPALFQELQNTLHDIQVEKDLHIANNKQAITRQLEALEILAGSETALLSHARAAREPAAAVYGPQPADALEIILEEGDEEVEGIDDLEPLVAADGDVAAYAAYAAPVMPLSPGEQEALQQNAAAIEALNRLANKAAALHGIEAIHLNLLTKLPGYDLARTMAFTYLNDQLNLTVKHIFCNQDVFEQALVPRLIIQPFLKRKAPLAKTS